MKTAAIFSLVLSVAIGGIMPAQADIASDSPLVAERGQIDSAARARSGDDEATRSFAPSANAEDVTCATQWTECEGSHGSVLRTNDDPAQINEQGTDAVDR